MTITESINFISKIESKFPVDQWTIDSVHIWPIIRKQLGFYFRDQTILSQKPTYFSLLHRFKTILKLCRSILGMLKYVYVFSRDSRHNNSPTPSDYIFLGDQVSRIQVRGKWYDRLCEPIMDKLRSHNKTSFHMDPNYTFRIPRSSASMFIQPHLDFLLLRSKLLTKNSNKHTTSLEHFDNFLNFLETNNIHFINYEMIKCKVATIKIWAKFFKQILRTVKPAKAFVVEYNSLVGMAFTLACHEHNITIIEIPHGNHGEFNIGYGHWNKIPKDGYELLPSIFWCWSDIEKGIIQKWAKNVPQAHNTFIGGNPWLSLWKYGKGDFIADYDREISALIKSKHAKTHLLITYEFNFGGLISLIKASPPNWHWWIRTHPIKLHEKWIIKLLFKFSGIKNFEIDRATLLPLYALLKHMDVHVTEYSSVVIESESFGVPSVITSQIGAEAFPNQVSSGWTLPAFTQEDIINAIFFQLEKRSELQETSALKVIHFSSVNFDQIL